MDPDVSIIIPCKEIDTLTIECINRSKELDHVNFEIIVLTDHGSSTIQGIKIIPTGEVFLGEILE